MDGMPHAAGPGDPTGRAAQHIDYAERKLDKACKELERARRVALRVCSRIRNSHAKKFCEAYFVEGFPFSVAQQMSGVKERQCYGYMQAINDV